ncbi:MAG: nucleotidyltransferase family protein [Halioglobus sp.]
MISAESIKINGTCTIRDALKIIDEGGVKIAIVVDSQNIVLGTVSDGDIRRGLLRGVSLEDTVQQVYSTTPILGGVNEPREFILEKAREKKVYQIPIVDNDGKLLGLDELDEIATPPERKNKVVLMIGGMGVRLKPLTDNIPKPMLNVGGSPILERIIRRFSDYGFKNFVFCVNYKAEIIEEYFGTGSKFGVHIEYVHETKRMGTAGALSLIKEKMTEPFFVMNGDVLTDLNFQHLYDFHLANSADATIAVRQYDFQIPYGVVKMHEHKVLGIEEKPVETFFVNAGIYLLEAPCLELIPPDQFFDMPTLFNMLADTGRETVSFPVREYWLDIGQIDDFEKAQIDISSL